MDCDLQAILDDSDCAATCLSQAQREAIMIVLLCRISQGGITPVPPVVGNCLLLESGVSDSLLLEVSDGCLLLET